MHAAAARVRGGPVEVDRVDWIRDPAAQASIEADWRTLESRVQHRTHVSTFDFLAAW